MMISVKYLLQLHAKKEDYHILGKNKFNDYLFKMDSLKKRFIDRRDILISSNQLTLAIISVKT